MKTYYVYIAELGKGILYVGMTDDLERRIIEHQQGKPSTRTSNRFGFRRLVYAEPHPDKSSALRRERQLKGWTRAKKLALARGDPEQLKALSQSR